MELKSMEKDLAVHTSSTRNPAELFFVAVFFLGAAFLLTQLGSQTKILANKSILAQPGLWPGLWLVGMAVGALITLAYLWRTRHHNKHGKLSAELLQWLRSSEYLLWFMGYALMAIYLGYLPSTLLFCAILTYRSGYHNPKTILWAVVSGFFIVVTFKTILQVKIPGGVIYEYLPAVIRNFMITYF